MKNVLFVCVENAGRSQMAESFFRKYAPAKYNVISAGTTPSSQLNPVVVEVMKEVGFDPNKKLSDQQKDDLKVAAVEYILHRIPDWVIESG